MQDLAPIILFVYNRKWHAEHTINSLKKNNLAKKSDLYVYSDGAKYKRDEVLVAEVRNLLTNINGFKSVSIIERNQNLGLANSVITGINEVLEKYDKAIVVEDDIVSSTNFLTFMNGALEYYNNDDKIFSVSGYSFPMIIPESYKKDVFVSYRSSSWGWGTWKNRWEKAIWDGDVYQDFIMNKEMQKGFNIGGTDLSPMLHKQIKGKIDSWAIRWAFTHYLNQAYCIFPVKSLAKNIGTDGTGINFTRKTSKYNVELHNHRTVFKFEGNLSVEEDIARQIMKLVKPEFITNLKNKLEFLLR